MKKIEDDFHFLLVCPSTEAYEKYLKTYFCHWPTLHKFENLMSASSNKVLFNLSKFIYCAMKICIA